MRDASLDAESLIPLFSRRTFSFSNVATGESLEQVMYRALPVMGYGAGTLLVRVHSLTIDVSATIEILATPISPSCDEPQTDFVFTDPAARVELSTGTAATKLHLDPLSPNFGSHLQIKVVGNQDPGSAVPLTAVLSADLAMKRACDQPVLLRHLTNHAYDTGSASKFYISFITTSEASSLSNSANALRMVAPYDGYLELVQLDTTSNSGSTVVGFHKNDNNTPSSTQTETVGASSPTKFLFGPSASFVQGDRLSISVDPTNIPTDVNVDCVWVFKLGTG